MMLAQATRRLVKAAVVSVVADSRSGAVTRTIQWTASLLVSGSFMERSNVFLGAVVWGGYGSEFVCLKGQLGLEFWFGNHFFFELWWNPHKHPRSFRVRFVVRGDRQTHETYASL